MTIRPASDRSLLISFGDEISADAHREVVRLTHALEGERAILNLHPAFASVLIDFDPRRHTHEQIEDLARKRLVETAVPTQHGGIASPDREDEARHSGRAPEGAVDLSASPRILEIPVRYGGSDGPDLEDVARHAGVSPERAVEIFSSAQYEVWFVGFSTCFPYLGGLPPELATPRLPAPRKLVPAGSVAIGGAQAGVYPLPSPGGWRIVGRTVLRLFDPAGEPPGLLRMGDRVRFLPV